MDKHMNEVLNEQSSSVLQSSISPGEIIIGEFLGFNAAGEPLVVYPGTEVALTALSTVVVTNEHSGRQVALLFANGDTSKPVIMGLIYSPLMDILSNAEIVSDEEISLEKVNSSSSPEDVNADANSNSDACKTQESNTAYVDGDKVVIEGKEEIVLKCGEASITLTKAGKILIRGKYLLNRSSGVNRILGGSVQVN